MDREEQAGRQGKELSRAELAPTPPIVLIRNAAPDEGGMLSRLAFRSKAFWGYDRAFMAACRDELAVSRADLLHGDVRVACVDGQVAGFHHLSKDGCEGEIEAFFVERSMIGKGVGRLLWRDMIELAAAHGLTAIQCQADPWAEGFYAAMGMTRIGARESASIPGRFLPLLRLALLMDERSRGDRAQGGGNPWR
jgi:GNAT superfamily N-acetyltransferase